MRTVSRQPSEAAARVAPLSVLPVFLDLKGRRAVVAGGSDAAAWKAELLAAAGAQVHVTAPAARLSGEFARLLAGGHIVHEDTSWDTPWNAARSGEVFAGAAVAVADVRSDEEAAAFAEAARRAGVPCNVIDRPEFCSFQFGSMVNRSPVVVGISSSGAAPILAQAIRRRIEALLPRTLAEWAALAQRLRATVAERLKPGGERRLFWEALADRAFGPAPGHDEEARLRREAVRIARAPAPPPGRITLVGAGPGEAELLTLRAVRALQAADAVFFDRGVSAEVLELARREAKRIPVGGLGGAAIGEMTALARSGKRVVHLRPGDAADAGGFIARAQSEGFAIELVPGVTASRPARDRDRGREAARSRHAAPFGAANREAAAPN